QAFHPAFFTHTAVILLLFLSELTSFLLVMTMTRIHTGFIVEMRGSDDDIAQHECTARNCQCHQNLFHVEPSLNCSSSTAPNVRKNCRETVKNRHNFYNKCRDIMMMSCFYMTICDGITSIK